VGKKKKKLAYRCPVYRNSKTAYGSRAVADYDRRILQARCPQFVFNVFKCDHCHHWHIGRVHDESGVVEEAAS
jgi:hypothetical protein